MKNHPFRILVYLIVLTFLFQPIQTFANSDKSKISDNSTLATAQNPVPGEPYPEQFEKKFEMEIDAERQRILEEHLREEGMPEELLIHEYGSDPQEKPEYIPPTAEEIDQTRVQAESFDCNTVTDVPATECEALVALYESTNGAGWTDHTNWLETTTAGNWSGVGVNDEHVTVLGLGWNQLRGIIPPELGSLTSLSRLALGGNHLSGEIPPELGSLTNLKVLDLSWNHQLSGAIPPELGQLTSLQNLYLRVNQLSGAIPPELGNLTSLYCLFLSNNQLSGAIPPELGSLSSLEYFELHVNQLSGAIPAELGNLTNLDRLLLSYNQLSGAIPLSFVNLTDLDDFHFDGTQLCEPTTPEFLAWKESVWDWEGTDIICPLNVDIGFRAVPDGYGFPNWGSINLSDFTFADLTRMFGTDAVCWKIVGTTCILKPKAELFVYQVNIPMAGHCLGMAVSSLRFYKDIDLPLSLEEVYFQVKDSAVLTNWQSETFSTTIRRNISYFHVMQQADPFKAYSDGSMKNTPSEILSEVSLAMSGAEQNYPILFFYRTDMRGGHAVTPYAVEDKGNGIYWIRIYDNNFPGYHDKKIIVDINNETWFYNDRYNGTRDSHNLGTAPISIFSQRPVCPWCENTLNTVPMMQLSHEGAGDLLIQDSYSRRLGFQDGVFYSEILGAYALPVLGGLDVDTQPIFYLPLTDEYALTLAGLPTKSVGEASIVAFGPGYGITINGIDVDSNTMDVISISNDGTTISYQPNLDQDLTYGFYLDTDNASWQLETSQVDVNASQISVITVDPFQKSLEIDNVQNNTGEYNLYFKRVSDDGTDYFASNKILFPALSSHYVHIDGWQETGSAQVDIDTNGDGVPEEIIYLGNQIKYIFLPFVYR